MGRKRSGFKERLLPKTRTGVSAFALWRFANGETLPPNMTAQVERQLKNNLHCRVQYRRMRSEAKGQKEVRNTC